MNALDTYWKCSSNDLFEQYQMKKFDELYEYSMENKARVFDLWNNGNTADNEILRKVLKYGKTVLEYFGAAFSDQPELDTIFKMGQLFGVVESLDKMCYQRYLEKEVDWSYSHELKKVKHLEEIVKALKIKGSMNHTELCDYLRISESTLSQTLKKAEPLKLVILWQKTCY